MTEPKDVLADLLRRLDGWTANPDTRYEKADEMVDVARRELRAALVRTPETLDALVDAVLTWPGGSEGQVRQTLQGLASEVRAASPAPDPGAGLRELSDAATPGPWKQTGTKAKPHWYVTSDTAQVHGNLPPTREDYTQGTIDRWIADAALIVAAVNYVRSLLAPSAEPPETT